MDPGLKSAPIPTAASTKAQCSAGRPPDPRAGAKIRVLDIFNVKQVPEASESVKDELEAAFVRGGG